MLQFFCEDLGVLDPAVASLIRYEEERQQRKLILIPSESQAPEAVREALGSVFQNIYAEGYPDARMHELDEAGILDFETELARYRRLSDQRYYKGVEYANVVEALARRRAAEAFAANGVPAGEIWANVQPLSGSPANNAVYAALVPVGSTVMGMDLLHGGHLTHGSPVNRSGKLYQIVSYGIDPNTERLDYGAIEEMARQHRPKMIIAGFTSYPWMPDWEKFRAIADSVGAYLMADISHVAGMVAAGVVASPIGHAHVITFTTHKTLYGPRGAVILTTDPALARKIDAAVFPGEQGGPHVNAMAGMAVAFKLARLDSFRELQQQVITNAAHLAAELERHGLHVPYGGTDTHMLLVDCKSVRAERGISPDRRSGTPLMGDAAARILDLAGIVLNRNTIPGDKSARNPSGIRLGTPWITQRGFREPEVSRLAEIIARVIKSCRPYASPGRQGPVYSAKIDFDVLENAKWDVVQLAAGVDLDPEYVPSGYPHHFFLHRPTTDIGGEFDIIEIEGPHARGFCNVAMTSDVYALDSGESQPTWVLESDGTPMAGGIVRRPGRETTRFHLLIAKQQEQRVAHWLRALSDGFANADPNDVYVKAPGPVVVRRLPHEQSGDWQERPPTVDEFDAKQRGWAPHKPYWIGMRGNGSDAKLQAALPALPEFRWEEPEAALRRTRLFEVHRAAGGKMVPFAGWEMPVQYSSVQEEHISVRNKAGLFDVSHMGLFEFSGENVHLFLNTITTNDVALIEPGDSQYSFLLAPDGSVIDDIWLYRLEPQRYWMVVNASNTAKDWAWIKAVQECRALIDPQRPWVHALGTECVVVEDLHDPELGERQRVQLALQGPNSRDILLAMMLASDPNRETLAELKHAGIMCVRMAGMDVHISRTGYTGEPVAFELFVHPDDLKTLWQALLQAGEPFGLRPVGLAARDSLRIEAGLPLYGHELAGPLGLDPSDAGFAAYVKLHKPFFVGKQAFWQHEEKRRARVVRFRVDDERAPLPGQGDVIVNRKGRVVGRVTSCSLDTNGRLTGLGLVEEAASQRGTPLGVYRLGGRNWEVRPLDDLKPGDHLQLAQDITVIERFLNKR